MYLDDLFLCHGSRQELERDLRSVLWLFQCLGFLINWGKSVLQPTRKLEFLGLVVDSECSEREINLSGSVESGRSAPPHTCVGIDSCSVCSESHCNGQEGHTYGHISPSVVFGSWGRSKIEVLVSFHVFHQLISTCVGIINKEQAH